MTYYQAELQWEVARRELRARLDALPSSSFARTMLEEDEVFYATFPEARRAAIDTWILSQQTPCPGLETYISGSGLQSYPLTPGIEFPADEHHAPVELSYPSNHIAHAPVRSPSPIYVDLNYDYHRADGELGEGQRKKKDSEPQAKQIKPEPEISVPAFVCSANAKVKTEPTEPEDGSMSDDSEDSGSDWSEA
ncbi:hypothetical protein H0H81_006168 [Sphagnurus paluster]|uniref:Uncharacterized protein n=1 Tax=Sphagnurus paluster TaxID=117069 RepID=A0A9P7FR37_9AGAR|nr:hypothetical protein H0H81_006168 [Sphagnurus paluster]